MFVFSEQSPAFKKLNDLSHELCATLINSLQPIKRNIKLSAGRLFEAKSNQFDLLCLKNGVAFLTCRERRLFGYEENDLLFIPDSSLNWPLHYESELAIIVDHYSVADWITTVASDQSLQQLWLNYFEAQRQLIALLLVESQQDEPVLDPSLEYIEADQTIIQQGELERFVCTMVEGSAEVFVDGTKVGEIKRDQIFGAFSCLTNSPRSASVIATSRCLLAKIPQDDFLQLINARPQAALQLLQEMAATIVNLNNKVVSFGSGAI